eukprot:maker-scaffold703_size109190-snap-gene-0.20 protein:Tk04142 transcript:maker-scaffold703_size109190-snap-gene-0.20-mRNA-1 annotation:"hypothetical protein AUEXF2481DRAFT_80673"
MAPSHSKNKKKKRSKGNNRPRSPKPRSDVAEENSIDKKDEAMDAKLAFRTATLIGELCGFIFKHDNPPEMPRPSNGAVYMYEKEGSNKFGLEDHIGSVLNKVCRIRTRIQIEHAWSQIPDFAPVLPTDALRQEDSTTLRRPLKFGVLDILHEAQAKRSLENYRKYLSASLKELAIEDVAVETSEEKYSRIRQELNENPMDVIKRFAAQPESSDLAAFQRTNSCLKAYQEEIFSPTLLDQSTQFTFSTTEPPPYPTPPITPSDLECSIDLGNVGSEGCTLECLNLPQVKGLHWTLPGGTSLEIPKPGSTTISCSSLAMSEPAKETLKSSKAYYDVHGGNYLSLCRDIIKSKRCHCQARIKKCSTCEEITKLCLAGVDNAIFHSSQSIMDMQFIFPHLAMVFIELDPENERCPVCFFKIFQMPSSKVVDFSKRCTCNDYRIGSTMQALIFERIKYFFFAHCANAAQCLVESLDLDEWCTPEEILTRSCDYELADSVNDAMLLLGNLLRYDGYLSKVKNWLWKLSIFVDGSDQGLGDRPLTSSIVSPKKVVQMVMAYFDTFGSIANLVNKPSLVVMETPEVVQDRVRIRIQMFKDAITTTTSAALKVDSLGEKFTLVEIMANLRCFDPEGFGAYQSTFVNRRNLVNIYLQVLQEIAAVSHEIYVRFLIIFNKETMKATEVKLIGALRKWCHVLEDDTETLELIAKKMELILDSVTEGKNLFECQFTKQFLDLKFNCSGCGNAPMGNGKKHRFPACSNCRIARFCCKECEMSVKDLHGLVCDANNDLIMSRFLAISPIEFKDAIEAYEGLSYPE